MNINSIAKAMVCVLLSIIATTITARTTEAVLAERVESMHSIVDMRYTDQVKRYIHQYTERYPVTSQRLLGQATVYFPILENIIREKEMPDHLKYLAVIESGLRPGVKSRVGATGMWQFMRSTGKMYGLNITSTVDERKDVIKATYAAMDYLADLHERFGDWTVALAAYNCGPGNVRKAMRRAGGATDYWSIQRYLPAETRQYVPKFIAMQYLMSYYHMHDIYPEMPEQDLRYLATAKVYDKVTFSQLSSTLGLDTDIIRELNPMYQRQYIPSRKSGNHLTLPEDALFAYLSQEGAAGDLVYHREADAAQQADDSEQVKVQEARTNIVVSTLPRVFHKLFSTQQSKVTLRKSRADRVRAARASYMAKYKAWKAAQE